MSSYNPFQPDSGRKEDYDGTVLSNEFKQNQRGGWDNHLTILADDGEEIIMPLSLYTRTTGDWVSFDGGESIEGPTASSHLNPRSNYMKFIGAAMGTDAADEIQARNEKHEDRRGPFTKGFWDGLRFHFDVVMEAGQRPDEEGVWKDVPGGIPVVRPVTYLGVADDAVTPSTGASTSPDDISSSDMALLAQHAALLDYDAWVDQVMELRHGDKAIMKFIAKKSHYEELRGES